jgi:CxxH/CxxC protein (TIGR04129 family)
VYVVCDEHLDKAIDEFVEVYESPPDLYRLGEVSFTQWTAPQHCDFCARLPLFLIV